MTERTSTSPTHEILALTLATTVLLGGVLLNTDPERVSAGTTALPRSCILHEAGLGDCPGCGLTRSVVACCHLRFQDSWLFHPGGILIVGLALVHMPCRLTRLLGRTSRDRFHWLSPLTRGILTVVLAIGLGRWVAEWMVRALSS